MANRRDPRTIGPKPTPRDLVRQAEARGLEVTPSRRVVLEALLALDVHPTADEVHEEALRRRPGIGRATVYRSLEQLVEAGLLTKALHAGAAVRYDVRPERHHHLVCVRCERIVDIADASLDAVGAPDVSPWGFVVQDVQVQMRGVCRDCRARSPGHQGKEGTV